ncbi:NAD(P)-binding protein [Teratosphaeria destructans]|uniref:NAD(P)-binding protein n=1 Tax=Teratosphaeria destructans TaxID=418781 RepID=A0A9W7W034_9PEZI|nr:NAD(P)-binding protein [Teratosphaeria destructans]
MGKSKLGHDIVHHYSSKCIICVAATNPLSSALGSTAPSGALGPNATFSTDIDGDRSTCPYSGSVVPSTVTVTRLTAFNITLDPSTTTVTSYIGSPAVSNSPVNASISTLTITAYVSDVSCPALGSTSTPSPSTAAAATQKPIVANASSLAGNSNSSPNVTAQVVSPGQNAPVTPSNTNSSFLLVTFGNTTTQSGGSVRKRQSSASGGSTYNATQSFSATEGGIYEISADAADAQNGNTSPDCALTICVNDDCGPSNQLTEETETYNYNWTTDASGSELAIFSITCSGQAYVALSNVVITPYLSSNTTSSSSASSGVSNSASSTPMVTTSIYLTTTLPPQTYTKSGYNVTATETDVATSYIPTIEVSTYVYSMTTTLPPATTTYYITQTTRIPGNTSYLPANTSYVYQTYTLTSTLPASTSIIYNTVTTQLSANTSIATTTLIQVSRISF